MQSVDVQAQAPDTDTVMVSQDVGSYSESIQLQCGILRRQSTWSPEECYMHQKTKAVSRGPPILDHILFFFTCLIALPE